MGGNVVEVTSEGTCPTCGLTVELTKDGEDFVVWSSTDIEFDDDQNFKFSLPALNVESQLFNVYLRNRGDVLGQAIQVQYESSLRPIINSYISDAGFTSVVPGDEFQIAGTIDPSICHENFFSLRVANNEYTHYNFSGKYGHQPFRHVTFISELDWFESYRRSKSIVVQVSAHDGVAFSFCNDDSITTSRMLGDQYWNCGGTDCHCAHLKMGSTRVHHYAYSSAFESQSTPVLYNYDTLSYIWVSWAGSDITYGTGPIVGLNKAGTYSNVAAKMAEMSGIENFKMHHIGIKAAYHPTHSAHVFSDGSQKYQQWHIPRGEIMPVTVADTFDCATNILTLPSMPAGHYNIVPTGSFLGDSATYHEDFTISYYQDVFSVEPEILAPGGGTDLTVCGVGFDREQTKIDVCGSDCEIYELIRHADMDCARCTTGRIPAASINNCEVIVQHLDENLVQMPENTGIQSDRSSYDYYDDEEYIVRKKRQVIIRSGARKLNFNNF